MAFANSGFAQFIASKAGRGVRAVTGLALIAGGVWTRDTPAGIALMAVGLIPLATGVFDLCLLSPMLGGPLSGRAIRACRS